MARSVLILKGEHISLNEKGLKNSEYLQYTT